MHDNKEAKKYLLSDVNQSEEADLRTNYTSLLEVTRLLLKQVAFLSHGFKTLQLTNQTDQMKQSTTNKLSEALEICEILRSAADLGKSPNEMIGYYLLGAKKQADELAKSTKAKLEKNEQEDSELLDSPAIKTDVTQMGPIEDRQLWELSLAAEQHAGQQRQAIINQMTFVEGALEINKKAKSPLIETKRDELSELENDLSEKIKELRRQFELPSSEEMTEKDLSDLENE